MGKNIFKIVIVAAMWLTAVSFPAQSFAAQLIFNSGFEADSRITGGYADITGIDRSVSSPNDWGKDTWDYDFNYVGGNSSQRKAEIVDDPTGATNSKTGKVNKVLHFWMREAPQGTNARTRVAAQIHQLDRTEWFSRRRIYVHPDMLLLSDFPGSSRVMSEEIKVIETSRDPHFRITLVWTNLGKSNFVWEVEGEDFRNQTFWGYQSKASLPIGEWFTAETYYKAGDKNTGRYVFAIQRKGKPKEVLFDVTNWTHHPNIPPAPADTWNPQKLYMSGGDDVDWIRNKGGAAQLYFDDWEVWSTKPDGGSTPTPTKKPTSTPSPGIQGDLDKDGDVDIFDYNILIGNFSSTNCGNVADIDGNCKVDIFDYNILVENFGQKATPTPTRTPTPTSIPSSPSPPSPPPSGSGHTYPRTAAMTFGLDSDSVTMNHYAQFDIVMARNDSPGFITQLRALNPSLEYLVNEDVNCGDNWFRNKPNEWMLHDSKGNQTGVDYCRGGVSPNLSDIGLRSNGKLYVEAFAEEAAQRVLSSGADGFMTDGLYYTGHYSWYTPDDIDLDRNGLNDMTEPGKGKSWFLNHWKAGIDSMISEIRNRIGADRLIIVNTGSQDCPTCSQINGLYFENTGGEINWSYSRSTALNLQSQAYPPPTFVMNLSFDPRNDQRPPGPTYFDYQYMRFGLCRALLLGEYFEPEAWEAGEHTWSEWYDEMSLDLGYPRGNMVEIAPGVWARIFTRGATICNLNGSPVSVNDSQLRLAQGYSGPYYRFRGCQDPTLNNGQQFTSLSLKGHRYIGYGNAEITVGDGVVVVDGPGISSCPDNPCPPGGYWRDGQCAR